MDDNDSEKDYDDNIIEDDIENILIENDDQSELTSKGDKYYLEETRTSDLDLLYEDLTSKELEIDENKNNNNNNEVKIDSTILDVINSNYNKMSRLEFISLQTILVELLKKGLQHILPDKRLHDNFEYCNEETLAVILLLKSKSNLYTVKDDKLYNIHNYPLEDIILNFKYYYLYIKEIDYIYKKKVLQEYFPNIIKNIYSLNITQEEINECIN